MDTIIKFQLFGEFCNKSLYGSSLADALKHSGVIRRPGHFDLVSQKMIPGKTLKDFKVIGAESTKGCNRGSKPFERVVVETDDSVRFSIDAINKCVILGRDSE